MIPEDLADEPNPFAVMADRLSELQSHLDNIERLKMLRSEKGSSARVDSSHQEV